MSEKSNMNALERSEVFGQFLPYPMEDEEERVKEFFTKYLIYSGKGKVKKCYCTECGSFEASGGPWKHNVIASCPRCGRCVTMKSYGRLGQYGTMREEHNVVFLRPGRDGALLVTGCLAVQSFVDGEIIGLDADELVYPVPRMRFYERRRYYMAPGKLAAWKRWEGPAGSFGMHCFEIVTEWKHLKNATEPFNKGSYLAPTADDGMHFVVGMENLKDTALRWSQVDRYFFEFDDVVTEWKDREVRNFVSYLAAYCVRPQLEMLVKLGHTDVIEELLNEGRKNSHLVNWKATTPPEFFRMSKADYKAFEHYGGTVETLRKWREYKSEFSDFREFTVLSTGHTSGTLEKAVKAAEIIKKPLKMVLKKVPQASFGLWEDYIRMATAAGYDFEEETVCFPKNLEERHDALCELAESQKKEGSRKRYKARYKALCRRYEYEAEGLCIVVPTGSDDIVREGKEMHHCVGGYAARHIEGVLDILFLRRVDEPLKPLATIEMNGNRMVQIRGPHNDRGTAPASETYAGFTTEWLAWIRAGSRRDTAGNPIKISKGECKKA